MVKNPGQSPLSATKARVKSRANVHVPMDECNALRGTSQSIALVFGLCTALGGREVVPLGVEVVRPCLDLRLGEGEAGREAASSASSWMVDSPALGRVGC